MKMKLQILSTSMISISLFCVLSTASAVSKIRSRKTFCGSLMLNCDRKGSTPEFWFNSSANSAYVSAEDCASAAALSYQCMCMDAVVQVHESMFDGELVSRISYRGAGALRACGQGSAAQRKVDETRAIVDTARAWCADRTKPRPKFGSPVLKDCNCVGGFFICQ